MILGAMIIKHKLNLSDAETSGNVEFFFGDAVPQSFAGGKHLLRVLPEHLRGKHIAGGPVVDPWQEPLRLRHAGVKIPDMAEQGGMEIVFLIIFVGKLGHERRCHLRPLQFPGQGPQGRAAHADDQSLIHRGYQGGVEIPVAFILEGEKPPLNLRHGFFTPP